LIRIALFIFLLTTQVVYAEVTTEETFNNSDTAVFDDFESSLEDEFAEETPADDFDPLSGYNRVMTAFNDLLFTGVIIPVAKGYQFILPEEARRAVSRFFDNLYFPIRFANNLLQLKFINAGEEAARFGINTTLGIAGLFDPAKTWFDLEAHPEDFGQTLGYYGVGGGFHIVLPIFGPSNLRDTLSLLPDFYGDPINYWHYRGYNLFSSLQQSYAAQSYKILNESSLTYEQYESLKKDAVDLYPFLKNIYEQSRQKAIEE
jgi:phospholipid-binding lipoprotein MlaA